MEILGILVMINVAVVGAGYFGKIHITKLLKMTDVNLVCVADPLLPLIDNVKVIEDFKKIKNIDSVIITTPALNHYAAASYFLENGVDIFVEKPFVTSLADADKLINLAIKNNSVLQVGFIERFNQSFKWIQDNLNIDKISSVICSRKSLSNGRGLDVHVVMDVMIHDIDLINAIFGLDKYVIENIQLDWDFSKAILRSKNRDLYLESSRISKNLVRKMKFICFNGISFDVDFANQKKDALEEELNSFFFAVKNRTEPIVTGECGRKVLEICLKIIGDKNVR
jgi:predicted dehydrogenase